MLDQLKPVFASLEKHDAQYLVIGGIAAILHGASRLTLDLDIVINPTPENSRRVLNALRDAGFGTAFLIQPEELLKEVVTIFADYQRIDVQTRTPGVEFEAAWQRRITFSFQGQNIFLLQRDDLIASKKAAGRPKDLEDVRLLENQQ